MNKLLPLAALISVGPAFAADAPSGPAPVPQYAKAADEGLIVTFFVQQSVPVTKTQQVQVNVGGMVVTRQVQVTTVETVTKAVEAKHAAKTFDVYDLDGKDVAADDWRKALKDGGIVGWSAAGKPDPAYLKVFKAGTLIVVPKPPAGGERPAPVPVPK